MSDAVAVENFRVFLRNALDTQFPYSFDDLYQLLEYSTKGNAKQLLLRHFIDGQDYVVVKSTTCTGPLQKIYLTLGCVKRFCQRSNVPAAMLFRDLAMDVQITYQAGDLSLAPGLLRNHDKHNSPLDNHASVCVSHSEALQVHAGTAHYDSRTRKRMRVEHDTLIASIKRQIVEAGVSLTPVARLS